MCSLVSALSLPAVAKEPLPLVFFCLWSFRTYLGRLTNWEFRETLCCLSDSFGRSRERKIFLTDCSLGLSIFGAPWFEKLLIVDLCKTYLETLGRVCLVQLPTGLSVIEIILDQDFQVLACLQLSQQGPLLQRFFLRSLSPVFIFLLDWSGLSGGFVHGGVSRLLLGLSAGDLRRSFPFAELISSLSFSRGDNIHLLWSQGARGSCTLTSESVCIYHGVSIGSGYIYIYIYGLCKHTTWRYCKPRNHSTAERATSHAVFFFKLPII